MPRSSPSRRRATRNRPRCAVLHSCVIEPAEDDLLQRMPHLPHLPSLPRVAGLPGRNDVKARRAARHKRRQTRRKGKPAAAPEPQQ
jgi:hypothetical protein